MQACRATSALAPGLSGLPAGARWGSRPSAGGAAGGRSLLRGGPAGLATRKRPRNGLTCVTEQQPVSIRGREHRPSRSESGLTEQRAASRGCRGRASGGEPPQDVGNPTGMPLGAQWAGVSGAELGAAVGSIRGARR